MTSSNHAHGRLAGRVAIVTGASRGIGEAIALRYAMEGARVAVAARTVEEGEHRLFPGSITSTVERIRRNGGDALAVRCDLADPADREALVRTVEAELGPVDILMNNGAVTYYQPLDTFPDNRVHLMFEVQVFAALHLAQLLLPSMRERGEGWIVNMSSGSAIYPELDTPQQGSTVYGMCKRALERFAVGLAAEEHTNGIRANALRPGLVDTPGVAHFGLLNDESRHREVPIHHVAEVCLALASGPPTLSGRVQTTGEFIEELALAPVPLPE